MPLSPFNLGNVIAQAEAIKGARMRNVLAEQSMDPNSLQNQYLKSQIYSNLNTASVNRLGKYNPGDYTPDSWSKFMAAGNGVPKAENAGLLSRYESPSVVTIANIPSMVTRSGNGVGNPTPLTKIDTVTGNAGAIKGAEQQATEKVKTEMEPKLEAKKTTAKAYAADSAANVVKAQNQIGTMLTQNRKLDRVIKLSNNGARTGPLIKFLPTLTAQTQSMEQLQKEMGLDIIGSVTFGALSKGELDLSMVTAIPTNMNGPDLVKWAKRKQLANDKLMNYMIEQVKFIRSGGTQAQWLDKVNKAGGINRVTSEDDPLGLRQ